MLCLSLIIKIWGDGYEVILIKYQNSSCNNCVINFGKKWTLQILIPQYGPDFTTKIVSETVVKP